MGLKSKSNFEKLGKIPKKYGVGLAATKPVVEMEWADKSSLVGISGQSIAPKLYVAFGVSGSIQHIEGIKGAEQIISINRDENAKINEISNHIIVEDAKTFLNLMI